MADATVLWSEDFSVNPTQLTVYDKGDNSSPTWDSVNNRYELYTENLATVHDRWIGAYVDLNASAVVVQARVQRVNPGDNYVAGVLLRCDPAARTGYAAGLSSSVVTGLNINSDVPVLYTYSIALGDVDGDGDLDLVAGNDGQYNRLYLNNGTPTPFSGVTGSDITTYACITASIALGDMDGDGDLDLVTGNDFNSPSRLYLNNGTSAPFLASLYISKKIGGPDPDGNDAIDLGQTPVTGVDVTDFNIKFAAVGSLLYAKVWTYGTAEPAAWQLQATDTDFALGVGGIGVNTGASYVYYFSPARAAFDDVVMATADRAALIALYNGTNGDSWTNNSGWKTPPLAPDGFSVPGTEGGWFGISADSSGNITVINLSSNNLMDSIPPEEKKNNILRPVPNFSDTPKI